MGEMREEGCGKVFPNGDVMGVVKREGVCRAGCGSVRKREDEG